MRPRQLIGVVRFWSKVDWSGGPDACWPWTASRHPTQGYGQFGIGRRSFKAHRIAAEQAGIVVTKDKPYIIHSCDVRWCCNPKHLRAGSHRDNMDDVVARQRQRRGARHPKAVLSDEAVREVRRLRSLGLSYKRIGKRLGINPGTAFAVITNKTWRHVR